MTTHPPFKDYLFNKFLEWEKTTKKKRSSFSAFARWLSDNSYNLQIKQQVVDTWMNGSKPKDMKYVLVLGEKIGNEVYDVLGYERPDPDLQRLNQIWNRISPKHRQRLLKQGEQLAQEKRNDEKRPAKNTT